ncbi:MAG: hypothetical protein ABWY82_14365, partial [Tardiphaga sp.]
MMLWQPTRGILQPGQHWRRGQGAAADTTTLDPAKIRYEVALSNGDLRAQRSGTTIATEPHVFTVRGQSTGKRYFEAKVDYNIGTANQPFSVGIASASHFGIDHYLGQNFYSGGFWFSASGNSAIY